MPRFPTCKTTVLKTLYRQELAEEYRRPDVHAGPCPFFTVGDAFIVDYLVQRPEGFECDWAWDDLHKILMVLMLKGDFATWMTNPDNFVACCTDGIKPVVLKVERLDAWCHIPALLGIARFSSVFELGGLRPHAGVGSARELAIL